MTLKSIVQPPEAVLSHSIGSLLVGPIRGLYFIRAQTHNSTSKVKKHTLHLLPGLPEGSLPVPPLTLYSAVLLHFLNRSSFFHIHPHTPRVKHISLLSPHASWNCILKVIYIVVAISL